MVQVILGVESTAHTFGASIVVDGTICSNVTATYTTDQGGMIPFEVADHHESNWYDVVSDALRKADVTMSEVDSVAFSQGPGIGHALRIGATVAKSLAVRTGASLIPVNHCIAHLEIGRHQSSCQDPVLLYVSGANTQVVAYESGRYRVFGETLDMGLGNFLDSVAREFDYGFPGGPRIEEAAKKRERLVELPYTVKGMDISLGGLFTHVKRLYHNEGVEKEVLANSVQETVFAMITEVAERALAHTQKDELVLGGGVACNQRLHRMVAEMCEARSATVSRLANEYLVDNAAMIGVAGAKLSQADVFVPVGEAQLLPGQRTDQVAIPYRY